MKIKDIKSWKWYETTSGAGEVLRAGGTHPPSVKMSITKPFPRGIIFVSPRDVLYEIEKPQ